jgi:Flp pilus assembly protein TadD
MKRNTSSSHKKAQAIVLCLLCLFVATVRSQSPDVVQLFEQIATLIQNNKLPQAEKELNSILRVTPDLPVALNLLGTIRAKQNRLLEAETLFLRALKKDTKFTGARMNLVYLYLLKRARIKPSCS